MSISSIASGKKILVVDDEPSMREVLAILLEKEGHEVTRCDGGVAAIEALQGGVYDLVITDLKMPDVSGIEVLRSAKSVSPETVVVMITAFGSADTAVEAMKLGAHDYIGKPFRVDEIRRVVKDIFQQKSAGVVSPQAAQGVTGEVEKNGGEGEGEKNWLDRIIGRSPAMRSVLDLLPRIAASQASVLITGESGTGKELIARAVHEISARRENPFVTVNCGAIPDNLLESELFGHVRGAFTSAVANKKGLFEIAHGGTLFLDEIGDMPLPLQVKLLRVLQDGSFRRVGGTEPIRVDVRIIAATNKDLKEALREGTFREDLYYRLNVLPVRIPPLRNRQEDIASLIDFFLSRLEQRKKLSPAAMEVLRGYPWWGNVRELENTIERLVVLSESDVIRPEHIPDEIRMPHTLPLPQEIPAGGVNLDAILADLEKRYLLKALEKTRGGKTEAARLLGMTFRSFRHRLSKYELCGPHEEAE